jgi:hypothetical protein
LDKIPGTPSQPPDPEIPTDALSNEVDDIVDNISDDLLDEAFDAEASTWHQMGLNPGANIQIDQFLFKSRLEVLIKMLMDMGVIEAEPFHNHVKRYMLKTMMTLRRQNEKQLEEIRLSLLQAKLTEGIQPPKDIFLPPGMKPNGN